MSEPEELPVMALKQADGSTFEATPLNTQLYSFIGMTMFRGVEVDADQFDHIFVQTNGDDEETAKGNFVFRVVPFEDEPNPIFMKMADFMLECDFPLRLNQRRVADCDKAAYELMEDQAINSAVEGWDGTV